jgi:ABC-type dipeptide/oligopeptide/nickel transport system ATPase component
MGAGIMLKVKNLRIYFYLDKQVIKALDGIELEIRDNEVVGLIGESGAGKTITGLSLTKIMPPKARVISGKVIFEGKDLLSLEERELLQIRGRKISYIFQEPSAYLNPVLNIGRQITEVLLAHRLADRKTAREKTLQLLRLLGLPEPRRIFYDYPHQLSGGMNQRVMISQAIAASARLLVADEPTSNLDVENEKRILDLLMGLKEKLGFSILFITHNLTLVEKITSRIYIMQEGKIVESGNTVDIFRQPQHPYTQKLLNAYIRLSGKQ